MSMALFLAGRAARLDTKEGSKISKPQPAQGQRTSENSINWCNSRELSKSAD